MNFYDTTRQVSARDLQTIAALSCFVDQVPKSVLYEVAYYVQRCEMKGFATTDDQRRLCANRYLAGKRKVSAPGTERRRKAKAVCKRIVSNPPSELVKALETALASVPSQKSDNKVINSIVGKVLKIYKTDPQAVRELIVKRLAPY